MMWCAASTQAREAPRTQVRESQPPPPSGRDQEGFEQLGLHLFTQEVVRRSRTGRTAERRDNDSPSTSLLGPVGGGLRSGAVSIHVVRHAKAGDRSEWDGPDEQRPLSGKGAGQATALVDQLAAHPVKRILTSHFRRCYQTVEPLAGSLSLDIETHAALAEDAAIGELWRLLEELAPVEAVVCTHGNLIGPILDRLHRQGAALVTDRWTCKKGSVWTIEVDADSAFSRARYSPPPA